MYQSLFLFIAGYITWYGCATVLIVYGRRASGLCSVIMSKVAMILMDIEWVVCSSIMNAEE